MSKKPDLIIDKAIFSKNLVLTRAYCSLQIAAGEKNIAKVFRSYNPVINNSPIFSFKDTSFGFEIIPGLNHCTLTTWVNYPIDDHAIIDNLFIQQLDHKKQILQDVPDDINFAGRIMIAEIDYTVLDGASEVQSQGLIDDCDIPPIDTWFYLIEHNGTRVLFAWIPEPYVQHANEAILVNCVDCLGWFDEWHAEEYKKYNL